MSPKVGVDSVRVSLNCCSNINVSNTFLCPLFKPKASREGITSQRRNSLVLFLFWPGGEFVEGRFSTAAKDTSAIQLKKRGKKTQV